MMQFWIHLENEIRITDEALQLCFHDDASRPPTQQFPSKPYEDDIVRGRKTCNLSHSVRFNGSWWNLSPPKICAFVTHLAIFSGSLVSFNTPRDLVCFQSINKRENTLIPSMFQINISCLMHILESCERRAIPRMGNCEDPTSHATNIPEVNKKEDKNYSSISHPHHTRHQANKVHQTLPNMTSNPLGLIGNA